MKRRPIFLFFLLALFNIPPSFASDTTIVKSPRGDIAFKLFHQGNQMIFLVTIMDIPVINPSPIEMVIDGAVITNNFLPAKIERYTINETYPWTGAHSTAVDKCNGAKIFFTGILLTFGFLMMELPSGPSLRVNPLKSGYLANQ
jgi:alpha-glucosidase